MNHNARQGLLLLACTAVACQSASVPPPRVAPAAAPKRDEPPPSARPMEHVTLAESWTTSVRVVREDSILLAMPDGTKHLEQRSRRARFSLTIGPGNNITVALDSLSYSPSLQLNDGTIGTTWKARLDSKGRLNDIVQSRHNSMTDDLEPTISELLPQIPRGGVITGMKWRDTTEGKVHIAVYSADEMRTSAWSVGEETHRDALVLLPISVAENFEQVGKGTVVQRATTMSAQGSRKGAWYLSLIGRVDNAVLTDSVAKLVTIAGNKDPVSTIEFTRTIISYRGLQ